MIAVAEKRLLDPSEMEAVLHEIEVFTETPPFKAMLTELRSLPSLQAKYEFVKEVVINAEELQKRGILVPEGMVVQRSYFDDDRPTLFCVVKYLKDKKRKMTFTFDDE